MDTIAPKSPASRLFTQPFIQTQIKENIKAPHHWPLCPGEFPAQMASDGENVSIWWRHSEISVDLLLDITGYIPVVWC